MCKYEQVGMWMTGTAPLDPGKVEGQDKEQQMVMAFIFQACAAHLGWYYW